MAKYNHFFQAQEYQISPIGKKIIQSQNDFFLQLIETHTDKNLSDIDLLEIGPGKGYFGQACLSAGINYQAIEENLDAVETLNNQGLHTIQSTVPPISTEKTYDVIFMNQVFEHMPSVKEAMSLMEETYNHLNEGGLIILGCPDILAQKEYFYSDYTHTYHTSIVRLTRFLSDFNFTPVYDKYYTFFFKGYLLTRLVTIIARLSAQLGILKLFFGKKEHKVLASLLPSFIIIGKR